MRLCNCSDNQMWYSDILNLLAFDSFNRCRDSNKQIEVSNFMLIRIRDKNDNGFKKKSLAV